MRREGGSGSRSTHDGETNLEQEAYAQLQAYTLAHGAPAFIHQHVVDAWAAQHADERSKPIGLTFALVGLYLHVERGFPGSDVQRVHMLLARRKRQWPSFGLPRDRGQFTAVEVMMAAPGRERDQAIDRWCESVWTAYAKSHRAVEMLLSQEGIG